MNKYIIFDFDGTLTQKGQNAWKNLWIKAGYSTNEGSIYRELYKSFLEGELTYPEWCQQTCQYLKAKNLSRNDVNQVGENTIILQDINPTFKTLKDNGYNVIILSGSVKQIIDICLKNSTTYISKIFANTFVYDKDNFLTQIIPTPYDFDGKRNLIQSLIQKGINKQDIIFIGNSYNDENVYETGVKTICINPETKNFENKKIWTNVVKSNSLFSILPILLNKNNNEEFQK